MPLMSSLANPTAWHILSYGTLLGTSIFNTFFQGIIAFKHLPRPSFSLLQTKLFPPYFTLQTLLPLASLLTYPTSSLRNLTSSPDLLYNITIPLGVSALCGAANWVWLGPWTTKVMKRRKYQELVEGKKYDEPGEKSAEMAALNKKFAQLHGASSLANLIDIIVLVYYGFVFAGRTTVVA